MPPETNVPDKRERLLEASLELLAAKGFQGFSIKQLATRAGVAVGTLYVHFEDREDLFRQLQHNIERRLRDEVSSSQDSAQPLALQYRQTCIRLWRFLLAHPPLTLSKLQFDRLPPTDLQNPGFDADHPLLALLRHGRAIGEVKALPDQALVSLGIEPYDSLARKQVLGWLHMDEQALGTVIDSIWKSLCSSPD